MSAFTTSHPGRARGTRAIFPLLAVLAAFALVGGIRAASASAHATVHATQQCDASSSSRRDAANPLDLPQAPGANPLTGAQFFVPGPAKGSAAGAIAQLLGLDPKIMPVDESWASFARQLAFGPLHDKLVANPALAHNVALLSKIASQPEAQRISSYSWGGTPSGIFKQTEKILCDNLTADPGTIPIFNTYFLHPVLGGCPTPKQVSDYMPLFESRVDAMAQAVGNHPAVFLLELDAIGSSSCVTKMGAMPQWEAALRYEMKVMQSLPHTVVYVEGGYSDSNSVAYTARILNAIGINSIRGFFTNDTHEAWTSSEARWATAIAGKTHGAHFIVDTADNGTGPLLNHDRVHNGNEDLCNPPGRGLGPFTTTVTGYRYADAWMWTHPPGNSSGCGGGPPGGVFWPARAEGEAARANNQLGPGLPGHPY
jgi:Glycosyl hydrolases family 6